MATSAGRLPFRAIIHVAGIDMWWRSSEYSVRQSVKNVMAIVGSLNAVSVAFPLIGAGSGGGSPQQIEQFLLDELSRLHFAGTVYVVRFVAPAKSQKPMANS